MSAETGDVDGFEVKVIDRGRKSSVAFVHCEGSCLKPQTWPAVVDGKSLSFTVEERWMRGPAEPVEVHRVHYSGAFQTDALLLRSSEDPDGEARLPRVRAQMR